MADIPDYLLQRSREARAKAKGEASPTPETPGEEAPAEEAPAEVPPAAQADVPPPAAEETPATEPEPAPAAAAAVAIEPAAAAPPPAQAEPKKVYAPAAQISGAKHGYRGAKVPGWLYPAYVLIPLLVIALILAVVNISKESEAAKGPEVPGQADYAAQCASCHGQDGGGGVGPAFKEVTKVFTKAQDHFDWIKAVANKTTGSYGEGGTGNAGKGATVGAMPAFGGSLTDEQIWGVVVWERSQYGGEALDKALADAGLGGGATGQ